MDRRALPPLAVAPDMPARAGEIRLAPRSGRHESRNEGEVAP